ncbi:MAG: NUDIX hydrolase [Brevefilum sp.]
MTFSEISREKHYRGHVFDVAKVNVRLPDGRERDYDLVEHGDSVTILPVDKDGNILFVSQHRLGSGRILLELPAGVLDPEESPLTSAQRELREETGKDASEFKELGGFYLTPGYTDEYMTVFLATGLYDAPLETDEDEFLKIKSLSITEAYQKALNGELEDGKSLAALFLAQPFLKKSN